MSWWNSTRHPVFRQLDVADTEPVIEEAYAREWAFRDSISSKTSFVYPCACVVAVVGATLTIVTVRRAARKEAQFASRFYKLLCANVVIQAIVLLAHYPKMLKWAGYLYGSKYGYYRNMVFAFMGCLWYPLNQTCFMLMFANTLCIVTERVVTILFPTTYKKFAERNPYAAYIFLAVQYLFVLLFLTPLTVIGKFEWVNNEQAYKEVYYAHAWNHKFLFPLYGIKTESAHINEGALADTFEVFTRYCVVVVTLALIGNVVIVGKVWVDSRKKEGDSPSKAKSTIKILIILYVLLMIGCWPMVQWTIIYWIRYAGSGYVEVVCRRLRGFEGLVSNITEPCIFLGTPCRPELEFASLVDVDRICRNDELITKFRTFGGFTALQLALDFYVYVALVPTFRDAFCHYVLRMKKRAIEPSSFKSTTKNGTKNSAWADKSTKH